MPSELSVCYALARPLLRSSFVQKDNFYRNSTGKCVVSQTRDRACFSRRGSATPQARMRRIADREDHDHWTPEKLGFLHVATLTGPHGVRGEIKAKAEGDFAKLRLGPGVHTANRYLLLPGRRYPRPVKVLAGRQASQRGFWILKVQDITDRNEVGKLRGARLYVKDDDRPKLQRQEYMVSDLVGSRVVLTGQAENPWYTTNSRIGMLHCGFPIGVVESVITRHDLCEASGGGARSAAVASDLITIAMFDIGDLANDIQPIEEIPTDAIRSLVPFVNEIVPVVDLKRGVVVLDPPEGLLTIARVNTKEKPRPPRGLLMPARD